MSRKTLKIKANQDWNHRFPQSQKNWAGCADFVYQIPQCEPVIFGQAGTQ